ncbi:MAG TPA: DUF5591 domain-containing protein [Anaerolineae bacterium]|nr:DUF5591 domain-containing protein [Anaerolineae bacterium]
MDRRELRYRVTAALLQAGQPLSLDEVAASCGAPSAEVLPILQRLLDERRVVAGNLVQALPAPQYCWRGRWEELSQLQLRDAQHELAEALRTCPRVPDAELGVNSAPSVAFFRYLVEQYHPPQGKRYLVFLQCSVRRPFSSSPSHASMRRAIRLATGADPRHDTAACPVHVVVLASKIGPVPYELEDLYPASVRGGGVKHLGQDEYERVKPVLAQRLAAYMAAHSDRYERYASFTEGRYGEVMRAAMAASGTEVAEAANLRIYPREDGPEVVRMGKSVPRAYWARYWIQLYLEVVSWLAPHDQARAARRLERREVECKW